MSEKDFGRGRILSPSAVEGELVAGELVELAVLGEGSAEPSPESRLIFAAASINTNYKLNDCIRNITAVCNLRQNSV